jgi:hypothetical protein
MEYSNLRISKLRLYLLTVIKTINANTKQINANMLSNKIDNYSLDKIPVQTEVERWILGDVVHRDVFSFRSRMAYSQDTINNLKNIGFFEQFESLIKSNNEKGILPDIDGIESVECLNCGTMNNNETNTAEFDIQIQITYRDVEKGSEPSL